MKKYLLNIVLFFSIVAVIDLLFGKAMDYMHLHAKGGVEKEMNDVCLNNQYDILIMGSSRAHHHYVPEIISDSLGMSCFNTGKDGNGIILMYGIYQMILNRYKPSLIIYDVAKGYDIYENPEDNNNTRYVSRLKPYCKEKGVEEVFRSLSWQEWYKTYSSLYRYNSISLTTARDFLVQRPYNIDGYDAHDQVMQYEPTQFEKEDSGIIDSLKIDYFEKFILSTKENNIALVCAISPRYRSVSSEKYRPVIDLCSRYDVPFFDCYGDTTISIHREFFKDASHMNNTGARLYSSLLARRIKMP